MGMQGNADGWVWFHVERAAVRIPADLAPFPHFSRQGWLAQSPPTILSHFRR